MSCFARFRFGCCALACLLSRPIVGFVVHEASSSGPSRRSRQGRIIDANNHKSIKRFSIPSWKDLEAQIGDSFRAVPPTSIDPAIMTQSNPTSIPPFSTQHPTLFRERHGWCPYSERVWLALELVDGVYDTVRIDNTGGPRPDYFGGQTPQMKWPENTRNQGESMDLVDEIDKRYNQGGWQHDDPTVRRMIADFRNIFPRARPSSRAAFLFQFNGDPLWKTTFETTLSETDALLSKTSGPYFVGDKLTTADIAWAPFLERYRYQLPCLHAGLEPNDASAYPHLAAWYKAMEENLPAYACRVKGDASSWRKVLTMAGFGNAGLPPQIDQNMEALQDKELQEAKDCINQDLWTRYAAERDYVAVTPAAEAARIVTTNRQAIIKDTTKRATTDSKWKDTDLPDDADEVDETLREMVEVLLNEDGDLLTNASRRTVGSLAAFLDERMCVPRDMGCMSAATIKLLAWNLQTFN